MFPWIKWKNYGKTQKRPFRIVILWFTQKLIRAHPETVFLPDLCVILKILSSEYQLYACGKILRMP